MLSISQSHPKYLTSWRLLRVVEFSKVVRIVRKKVRDIQNLMCVFAKSSVAPS